jgi:alkylated DNA repair dioxygenase AlkB
MLGQINLFESNQFIKTKFDLPNADVTLFDQFFSQKESFKLYESLLHDIDWQQDKIKMYGRQIDLPRLTAYYGDSKLDYTYSGIKMTPLPWTDDLIFIKNRIEKELDIKFTSCLLNYYRSGNDSMGWHQDNEKELGLNPSIASVSFGETRPFQLKHIDRKELPKTDILLNSGSLLLMKGTTQHYWKHQIPKTTKTIEPRINLTFRIIK